MGVWHKTKQKDYENGMVRSKWPALVLRLLDLGLTFFPMLIRYVNFFLWNGTRVEVKFKVRHAVVINIEVVYTYL